MRPLFLTKVSEVESPDLIRLIDEVCGCVRFSAKHYPEHTIHDLLSIIFSKHRVTSEMVPPFPENLLTSKLEKLAGSAIYDLARELAEVRRKIQIGKYDGKTLLTFLRDCYPLEKKNREWR